MHFSGENLSRSMQTPHNLAYKSFSGKMLVCLHFVRILENTNSFCRNRPNRPWPNLVNQLWIECLEKLYNNSFAFKKKVQVGKDQEKAQSEKDSHSKNQDGKKKNQQSGTYTMKTFSKPNEQLFS